MIDLDIQSPETTDQRIEKQLRSMIEQGKLLPGEKLPAIGDMAQEWHVGRNSIGKAMKRLAADGFIECKPKLGSFVKERSSRALIGILLGNSLSEESSFFTRAVYGHLRNIIESENKWNWICRVYDNLSLARSKNDIPNATVYQNFLWDLKNYGFKGLIKLYGGLDKEEEFVLKQELPRARFGVIPEISDLMLDFGDFARESVSFMKSKNVHKIVYLRTLLSEREGADDLEAIKEVASSQNVEVLQMEEEALTSDRIQKIAYEKIASLIDACRSGETEMPGALLISDDIAAKGAIRALREKSADTEKILLAVMTNSGIEHDYGRPVVKYEFSTREIAEILIGILRKKMLEAAPAESPIKIKGKIKAGGSL